jgi:hypothetical protein
LLGNSSQQWRFFSFSAYAVARWLILLTTELSTELTAPTVLVITPRHGSHRKRSSFIVAFVSVAAGTCFQSHCTETTATRIRENTVFILLSACMLRALPSNGHCLQSHCLATGQYATILFLSPFRQIPGLYFEYTTTASFQIPSNLLFIYRPTIRRYVVQPLTASWRKRQERKRWKSWGKARKS